MLMLATALLYNYERFPPHMCSFVNIGFNGISNMYKLVKYGSEIPTSGIPYSKLDLFKPSKSKFKCR